VLTVCNLPLVISASLVTSKSEGSPTNPALYTLLGVAITTVVSLVALFIKHRLDVDSARRAHEHELAILKLKLAEDRAVRHLEQTRKTYAAFLTGTAQIYRDIVEIRRARRNVQDDEAYRRSLNAIRPDECQVALEELRLLADQSVSELADAYWDHLRSAGVPTGADLTSEGWKSWKEEYWRLRKDSVQRMKLSVREELS